MVTALILGGVALAAVSWMLVARGTVSVWAAMTPTYAVLGALSLLTGRIAWTGDVGEFSAAVGGFAAGLALWGATRAFVAVVRRWPAFERHVAAVYDQRGDLSLLAALALAALVVSPGEELFWRGLVQSEAAPEAPAAGAALAWGGYVAVNAASRRLPIVAAAVVAGAVWGALAWWSGGVLAPMLCHVVWTGSMIALPPRSAGR